MRRKVCLRACWRMVWADGKASLAERDLIALWGKWLGWTPQQIQALAHDYEPERKLRWATRGERPIRMRLRILGVTATTEPAVIKRA